jgi:hypothetical protein
VRVRESRAGDIVLERFFRPVGARSRFTIYPRLAPWALFSRRFAAFLGPTTMLLLASKVATPSRTPSPQRRRHSPDVPLQTGRAELFCVAGSGMVANS